MQRILKYIISENTTPVTILDFLKKRGVFPPHIKLNEEHSNTIILNSERGFGRSVLKPQDHLIVTVPETESGENIIRTKMDLNIIYEDEDILVINKPADMPVHPSAGNYENTLANGIAWYFAEKGEILFTAVSTGWTGIPPGLPLWQNMRFLRRSSGRWCGQKPSRD